MVIVALVMICSLLGSLIPQDRPAEWYLEAYPRAGKAFLALGIDNLFYTAWFVVLLALLCVNLASCLAIRLKSIIKPVNAILRAAGNSSGGRSIGAEAAEGLGKFLAGRRFRQYKTENAVVFYKNMPGRFGSFIVHISFLLILLCGGGVTWLSVVSDHNVMPGEGLIMGDGTTLDLESFRIEDETGRTDYASVVHAASPDGKKSVTSEISVNYPLSFRSYKFYQHTFGVAGSVTYESAGTGESDVVYLTEPDIRISVDNHNSIRYMALYPGFVEDEDGNIIPIMVRGNVYPNPIYYLIVTNDRVMSNRMVQPGEAVEIDDVTFTFNDPVHFPGIRVKRIPFGLPALLYGSFVLMILGFYLSFFHVPLIVTVRVDSYLLSGYKSSEEQFRIDAFLDEFEKRETVERC
ncbi:MAG: cytochrome c biogenesis protein ResB [Treponema sp.]|nr:cytochrome c biogenesis protein ResB [Treponema sp.]